MLTALQKPESFIANPGMCLVNPVLHPFGAKFVYRKVQLKSPGLRRAGRISVGPNFAARARIHGEPGSILLVKITDAKVVVAQTLKDKLLIRGIRQIAAGPCQCLAVPAWRNEQPHASSTVLNCGDELARSCVPAPLGPGVVIERRLIVMTK